MDLLEKVEFLKNKSNYPENPAAVEARETHMSWVFLSADHVYKLKKPVHYGIVDFRTLEDRHYNCREEVRLNKLLGGDVYINVEPLSINENGNLQLSAKGQVVDWLVKMKRLPDEKMLDFMLLNGIVDLPALYSAARILSKFYNESSPAESDLNKYRQKQENTILELREELKWPLYGISKEILEFITDSQLSFLVDNSFLFDERVRKGKIIEVHGDLKPEHICLTENPLFIDRLEFDKNLRTMDPVDEVAFLSIECERLGNDGIGEIFYNIYFQDVGDRVPRSLIEFYKSKQALTRCMLTVRHIREERYRKDPKWRIRGDQYLSLSYQYARSMIES